MSYIGVQPTAGQYRKLDDISGSFNGSTTTFTTQVGSQNVSAGTAQQLLVSLGGVIQNPITDYTVSTNSITFTTAPAAGLSFFAVLMGEAVNTGTPSDGVVTGAKLSAPFNYNSGLLYLDSSNNRVGIGTTTVSDKLHVDNGGNDVAIRLSRGVQYGTFGADGTGIGVKSAGTDPLYFSVNGTERARLDSSGRWLLGTSSSSSDARLLVQGRGTDSTAQGSLYIQRGGTGSGAGGPGSGIGEIIFAGSDASQFASIKCDTDAGTGTNDYPGRLVFSVTRDGASSPTEAMRINNSGMVDVYTPATGNYAMRLLPTSGADRDVLLAGVAGATNGFRVNWINGSSVMAYRFESLATTVNAANAYLESTDGNRLYRSTSSIRYKTDVENIDAERSNAVLNLRPVWYRSKSSADPSEWSWYGLIAEEVAEVEPRLVHWGYLEDDYEVEEVNGQLNKTVKEGAQKVPDGVQYDRLAVLLLDVVKRQQQTIEALEARVAALESA